MWSLYQSLDESSPMRFHVYSYLVQLAGRTGQIELVFKDVDAFRLQITSNPPPNDQLQKLLRNLHEILRTAKKSEQVRCLLPPLTPSPIECKGFHDTSLTWILYYLQLFCQ